MYIQVSANPLTTIHVTCGHITLHCVYRNTRQTFMLGAWHGSHYMHMYIRAIPSPVDMGMHLETETDSLSHLLSLPPMQEGERWKGEGDKQWMRSSLATRVCVRSPRWCITIKMYNTSTPGRPPVCVHVSQSAVTSCPFRLISIVHLLLSQHS